MRSSLNTRLPIRWTAAAWVALSLSACHQESAPPPPSGESKGEVEAATPTTNVEVHIDGVAVPARPVVNPTPTPPSDVIVRENQRPGTAAWLIDKPASPGEIEGYALAFSVNAGDPVDIAVSTSTATTYTYEVYRTGDYAGLGGRRVAQGGPLSSTTQPAPTFDPATGLVEAHWKASFQVSTMEGTTPWVSGVYLVKLTAASGNQSYAIFILRDDATLHDVQVQLSTATWQAYNPWGGESLYTTTHGMDAGRAFIVSYDRPYAMSSGWGSGWYVFEEMPLVRWLEAGGYDISYTTNFDVGSPARGGPHARQLFIGEGHDEYATIDGMDRLEAALDGGVSLAFLSGNSSYWQVRYEMPDGGWPVHEVCYKHADVDPLLNIDNRHVTTAFRLPPVNRPENELIGVQSNGDATLTPVDWVVTNASHWAYDGTGVHDGDHIPGAVFYEWDSVVDNQHTPAGLQMLSYSPVTANQGLTYQSAIVYERGSALVFSAGSVNFGQMLATEPRLARMMKNVLARVGVRSAKP